MLLSSQSVLERTNRSLVRLALGAVLAGAASAGQEPPISFQETQELWANDANPNDLFGSALALDEGILVVGAPNTDEPGLLDVGAAYVFERVGNAWTQTAKLVPSTISPHDLAANRLAVCDGMVFLGVCGSDIAAPGAGAVFVFGRTGPTWTEVSALAASDAAPGDCFSSVSAQSGTLVVGAARSDDANPTDITTNSGSAYIFTGSGATWSEQAKLVPLDTARSDAFGYQTAMCGGVVAVSATGDDVGNGPMQGSVYLFEQVGATWVERQKLTASDGGPQHLFGTSLALGQDGSLLIGAKCAPPGGAAYVFRRVGNSWTEEAKLSAGTPSEGFGFSVAVRSGFAVIGAASTNFLGIPGSGTAFLYSRTPTGWVGVARLEQSDPELSAGFGLAVALSEQGAYIGAGFDTESGTWGGSVYGFDLPLPTAYCTAKTNSRGCTPFASSLGTPSVSMTSPFHVSANDALPNEVGLLFYGFKKANLDFHGGKLCIKLPFVRLLPPKAAKSGSLPCSGALFRNFNARIQSGSDPLLTAGQVVRSQWLQRDPGNGFFGDSLTDALQFTILP